MYFNQLYFLIDFFIDAQTPDSTDFQAIAGVHQLPYFTSFTLDNNPTELNSNASNDLVIEIEWEETRTWPEHDTNSMSNL